MTTAYAQHPLSKEEKKSLLKKFDKVVDLRFKPEKLETGDKVIEKEKAK